MGNIVFLRKILFDQACCRTLLFILIFMRKQVQEEKNMKNKTVKALAIAMTVATVIFIIQFLTEYHYFGQFTIGQLFFLTLNRTTEADTKTLQIRRCIPVHLLL